MLCGSLISCACVMGEGGEVVEFFFADIICDGSDITVWPDEIGTVHAITVGQKLGAIFKALCCAQLSILDIVKVRAVLFENQQLMSARHAINQLAWLAVF